MKSLISKRALACNHYVVIVIILVILLLIIGIIFSFTLVHYYNLVERVDSLESSYKRLAQNLIEIYANIARDLSNDLNTEGENALNKAAWEYRDRMLSSLWAIPDGMQNIFTSGHANNEDKELYNNAFKAMSSVMKCLAPNYDLVFQLPDKTRQQLSELYWSLYTKLTSESGVYYTILGIESNPENFGESINNLKPVISQINQIIFPR